jgi:hypothetical protein
MRRSIGRGLCVLWAVLAATLVPATASAWGTEAHQFVMRRAIEALPPELKPFFEHRRDELVVRVVDPDTWRSVGWPENPNHFLDFGVKEFGPDPFDALPRDYGLALQKFGAATLDRNGRLPWRFAEQFGNLRRAFEAVPRLSPHATSEIVLFAAVGAHYIQDAYQPLHATDNYDGAQTGQRGVHARFERDLFERYQARLTVSVPAVTPLTNPRDAAFDVLLASHRLVGDLLKADKEAAAGRDRYDDVYFERFFDRARTLLEARLSGAIAATAGFITGAWVEAGRPALRLQDSRPVQRIERDR